MPKVKKDTSFPLFPSDPTHVAIGDELDNVYSDSSNSKKGEVYLRGQVFVNNYGLHFLKKWYCEYIFPYNTIRPVRGIPFIVGDEEQYF